MRNDYSSLINLVVKQVKLVAKATNLKVSLQINNV